MFKNSDHLFVKVFSAQLNHIQSSFNCYRHNKTHFSNKLELRFVHRAPDQDISVNHYLFILTEDDDILIRPKFKVASTNQTVNTVYRCFKEYSTVVQNILDSFLRPQICNLCHFLNFDFGVEFHLARTPWFRHVVS